MKTYIKDVRSLNDWLAEIRQWGYLHGAKVRGQSRISEDCVRVEMCVPGFTTLQRPEDFGAVNVAILARGLRDIGLTVGDLPIS